MASRMKKRARRGSSRKRIPRKHKPNTSKTLLFPWQVAEELLISETSVLRLIALGPGSGGIRGISIGAPGSLRPRKLVHVDDLRAYIAKQRGEEAAVWEDASMESSRHAGPREEQSNE